MEADITSQAVGLASNTDFSIIQLFVRADVIIKSVLIILLKKIQTLKIRIYSIFKIRKPIFQDCNFISLFFDKRRHYFF